MVATAGKGVLEAIRHCEIGFPAEFAERTQTEWGLLYFTPDISLSHDGNHARILFPDANADGILDEIVGFYSERGREPRVRESLQEAELDGLGPFLERRGFRIEADPWTAWILHDGETFAAPDCPQLAVRRVEALDDGVVALIHSERNRPWAEGAMRRQVLLSDLHFYVGYSQGVPVSMVVLSEADIFARVDHVLTAPQHRRRGFVTALVRHTLLAHRALSDKPVYLITDNPAALRVYERCGFQDMRAPWQSWHAYLPANPPSR